MAKMKSKSTDKAITKEDKIQSVLDAIQVMHSYYVKQKVNVGSIVENLDSNSVSK